MNYVVRLELLEVGVDHETGNEFRHLVDAWESQAVKSDRLVGEAQALVWNDLARVDFDQ